MNQGAMSATSYNVSFDTIDRVDATIRELTAEEVTHVSGGSRIADSGIGGGLIGFGAGFGAGAGVGAARALSLGRAALNGARLGLALGGVGAIGGAVIGVGLAAAFEYL